MFCVQDLLLERNALLECAYAMASGGGLGAGSQPRGDKQPAMAWWLTEQMQVQAAAPFL